MHAASRQAPRPPAAIERVKEWTRERFKLRRCADPGRGGACFAGCPPLETVVVFWTEGDSATSSSCSSRSLRRGGRPSAGLDEECADRNGWARLECC